MLRSDTDTTQLLDDRPPHALKSQSHAGVSGRGDALEAFRLASLISPAIRAATPPRLSSQSRAESIKIATLNAPRGAA